MKEEKLTFEPKENIKTVFVFGAGMEMFEPLNLPSSKDLPIELLTDLFIDSSEDIKKAAKYIKEQSKCSYTFENLIYSRIKDIFQDNNDFGREEYEDGHNSKSEFYQFIKDFKNEVKKYKSGVTDLETSYKKIRKRLFGAEDESSLPNIIDSNKLSLNMECSKVIEAMLKEYVKLKKNDSPDTIADRDCLGSLFQGIVNYDSLLTDNYIGYYKNNKSAKSRYLYLSWLLWLFLIHRERKVGDSETIYNKIDKILEKDDHIITMNYTTFVDRAIKDPQKITHFHGDISGYIRGRKEKEIAEYSKERLDVILMEVLTGGKEGEGLPIPRMMPPFDIKPLISYEYLDRWIAAKNEINEADRIIVVGYSFADADNHFNDMLFNAGKAEEIIIVDKGLDEEREERLHNKFGDDMWKKVKIARKTSAEEFFDFKVRK